ncbi:ATP-dependent DNA helicase [uncultured archaeon]|nr:ATP-dependent DNA helicase [uncultured archaeon]
MYYTEHYEVKTVGTVKLFDSLFLGGDGVNVRRPSLDNVDFFPYPVVRGGQKAFLGDVEEVVRDGGFLFAHAPTGIGKTAAALAPSLKDALGNNRTVFFLTPKHTQHRVVVETLQAVKRRYKVDVTVVDIVGKQWMCPHEVQNLDSREFNEYCRIQKREEVCREYVNTGRVVGKQSEAMKKAVGAVKKEPLHNEDVLRVCGECGVCPYEVCVDVVRDAHLVICDYYHLFSEGVRKAFLGKAGKRLSQATFIVDEAHNLPERIRSLQSVSVSGFVLKNAAKEAGVLGRFNLQDEAVMVEELLRSAGKRMREGDERFVEGDAFVSAVEKTTGRKIEDFREDLDATGEEVLKMPRRFRSYCKTAATFIDAWLGEDVGYARILRRTKDDHRLSYQCLDPSLSASKVFDGIHAAVFMSGTLLPLEMYADVLGVAEKKTRLRAYPSPFPPENRLVLSVPFVTTQYKKRTPAMFQKIADVIKESVAVVPGNVAIFYPAYHLMQTVQGLLDGKLSKPVFIERQDMTKKERHDLYRRLIDAKEKGGAVLAGVQAGSLSEGVDYPGVLDAVIVVGLPLETPDLETKSLINYYDVKFKRGWDYGYIYPAVNRALQAAGRCIRSETDRGAILLLDERFSWKNYSKCFPPDYNFTVAQKPAEQLKRFFASK